MKKRLFGVFLQNIAELKILDVLLNHPDKSFSLSELCKESLVSWSTLHRVFPKFLEFGLVMKEREVGRAKLYRLNMEKEVVYNLVNANKAFLLEDHHEYMNHLLQKHV